MLAGSCWNIPSSSSRLLSRSFARS
jgi:DNA-binding transcriptional LysR family regulator